MSRLIDPKLLIEIARKHLGAPYVWRGKGKQLWTLARGLVLHPWVGFVFDCSGLVTWAYKQAGGPDLRATHAAQTMFDKFPEAVEADAPGVLRFYGKSKTKITHVSICTGKDAGGRVLVLEAAGGDETTTTPELAQVRGACVREGVEKRPDFIGARRLP